MLVKRNFRDKNLLCRKFNE